MFNIEEILSQTFSEDKSCDTFIKAKLIQKRAKEVENEAEKNIKIKDEKIKTDAGTLFNRVSYTYDYLGDGLLSKYEKLLEEKSSELKEIKDSVKNRQKTLEQEGKAMVKDKKETLILR